MSSSSASLRWIVFGAWMLCFGGCASLRGSPDWPTATSLVAVDALYAQALADYYATDDAVAQQAIRNRFIETRVGLIDRVYADYKQTIYSQRVGSSIGVDVATLALSAVGAAVSDVATKTATSALSGGLIGSKASIDKNAYFDRTLPALLEQMDGMRAQVRAQLLTGMLVVPERYSLMQAASDTDSYFHAGTIPGAIANITTQAATDKRAAQDKLAARLPSEPQVRERLAALGFDVRRAADAPSSFSQRRCIDAGGRLKDLAKPVLETWLRAQKDVDASSPFALTDFLTAEEADPLRKRALSDPKLQAALDGCNKQ